MKQQQEQQDVVDDGRGFGGAASFSAAVSASGSAVPPMPPAALVSELHELRSRRDESARRVEELENDLAHLGEALEIAEAEGAARLERTKEEHAGHIAQLEGQQAARAKSTEASALARQENELRREFEEATARQLEEARQPLLQRIADLEAARYRRVVPTF